MKDDGSQIVGELEVKITCQDVIKTTDPNWLRLKEEMKFDKEWNQLITERIAQRLAQINAPVQLIFGVFTYGQQTVSIKEFKQVLLDNFGLKKEITESEMDLYLENTEVLSGKNSISSKEFLAIFE